MNSSPMTTHDDMPQPARRVVAPEQARPRCVEIQTPSASGNGATAEPAATT